MTINEEKQAENATRVWRRADLPQERSPATYLIETEGRESLRTVLQKSQRQVIELLRKGPVYCASPVRISDIVHILKRDCGLDVETTMYPGNPKTGAGAYGTYTLKSRVTLVEQTEVAA